MKRFLIILVAIATLAACKNQEGPKESTDHAGMTTDSVASCCSSKDGLLIHLSSGYDNPHKVLMALKMASMMAMDENVLVYVDIKGVDLLLKTSKDLTYKDFPTLYELLDKLAEEKVTVMACPSCLKAAGYTPEELRPGVIVAEKDKFFNFTKGKIVTLDY